MCAVCTASTRRSKSDIEAATEVIDFVVREPSIIGVKMMFDGVTLIRARQILGVDDELPFTSDRALRHTAVHDERSGVM